MTPTWLNAAWAWVAPVLPAARPGGRPRTTDLRSVLNAIFYFLRTGRQWRLLPREFPPWGTVYRYFQAWQNCGVWVHLHRTLYEQARRHAGREACPSVVILDGQSVKTTVRGGAWFWHVQANKGPQTSHFSRYAWATGLPTVSKKLFCGSLMTVTIPCWILFAKDLSWEARRNSFVALGRIDDVRDWVSTYRCPAAK